MFKHLSGSVNVHKQALLLKATINIWKGVIFPGTLSIYFYVPKGDFSRSARMGSWKVKVVLDPGDRI